MDQPCTQKSSLRPFTSLFVLFLLMLFSRFDLQSQPDLAIDLGYLQRSMFIEPNYNAEDCEYEEACVFAPTNVKVLRFGTRSMNIGNEDLVMGNPQSNPDLFDFDPCHGHYHFGTFATYDLYDLHCNSLGLGHKIGFCLMNSETVDGSPRSCEKCSQLTECGGFNCSNQGLGAGCADVYSQFLDCQLLDITNIPNGKYYFVITLNFEGQLPEVNFSNNAVGLLIDIQGNNVSILKSWESSADNWQIANVDNNAPPNNILPAYTIASDTIEISGNTTIRDNTNREIISGHQINVRPGFGTVTISSLQGGSTHLEPAPCLATLTEEGLGHPDDGHDQSVAGFTPVETFINLNQSTADNRINPGKLPSIKIYPNPTLTGEFTVELPAYEEDFVQVFIYDTNGKLIVQKTVTGVSEIKLDLSNRTKGVYLVNILTGDALLGGKIAHF